MDKFYFFGFSQCYERQRIHEQIFEKRLTHYEIYTWISFFHNTMRQNGRDLTQSYDKRPFTHRKSKKHCDNIKNATKNFDYTTIVDRLRTVSWSNSSHPTGVVKPGLRALNLPTHRKSSVINRTWHDRTIVNYTNKLSRRCHWIHVKN